jgi:hypothetical protein
MKTTKTKNRFLSKLMFQMGTLAAVLAFIVMGCSSPLETSNGVQSEGGAERERGN